MGEALRLLAQEEAEGLADRVSEPPAPASQGAPDRVAESSEAGVQIGDLALHAEEASGGLGIEYRGIRRVDSAGRSRGRSTELELADASPRGLQAGSQIP